MVDRAAVLLGAGLVIYGASLISPAAGWIVAGCLLLIGATWRKP